MSPEKFDIVIVGGGLVGLATAMALTQQSTARVLVVEAETELAAHQSGHNSGVIHSGLYYKPGSLKARNCVAGRELMYAFCAEHGVAYDRCGKLVVAINSSQLPALDELERRGAANGLAGLCRVTPEQIREREPHVSAVAGLEVPETGIVDYKGVAREYARLAQQAGGTIEKQARVVAVQQRGDGLTIETTRGEFACGNLINCAGLQSDRVAQMCGVETGVRIIPFRGEYYQLIPSRESLVRDLIYPVPDARFPFLGVHFTRMIQGGIEAGPNAVLALARHGYTRTSFSPRDVASLVGYGGFWRMAARYWRTGCGELYRSWSRRAFVRALQMLVPELRYDDIVPAGAGVRAQAVAPNGTLVDDFVIAERERMIHVVNAPSPAATASISIGRTIAELAVRNFSLSMQRRL
ncbi:MAG: L-2-hydroxyglutarate oxidase [Pirellulales bacterium]|nr:L-2-hydroxyglutarate oxidase [Pirellulales bacterium]